MTTVAEATNKLHAATQHSQALRNEPALSRIGLTIITVKIRLLFPLVVISNWYSLYRYVSKPDGRAAAQPPSQNRPDFNDIKSCQVGCKGACSWMKVWVSWRSFSSLLYTRHANWMRDQLICRDHVHHVSSSLTWTNKSASASTSLSWALLEAD